MLTRTKGEVIFPVPNACPFSVHFPKLTTGFGEPLTVIDSYTVFGHDSEMWVFTSITVLTVGTVGRWGDTY